MCICTVKYDAIFKRSEGAKTKADICPDMGWGDSSAGKNA